MCFSNLPVEFDEEGNPYLAEEADDVARPGPHDDCGCTVEDADAEVSADPEGAYEAIVSSLPADAREQVAEDRPTPRQTSDHAEGD